MQATQSRPLRSLSPLLARTSSHLNSELQNGYQLALFTTLNSKAPTSRLDMEFGHKLDHWTSMIMLIAKRLSVFLERARRFSCLDRRFKCQLLRWKLELFLKSVDWWVWAEVNPHLKSFLIGINTTLASSVMSEWSAIIANAHLRSNHSKSS